MGCDTLDLGVDQMRGGLGRGLGTEAAGDQRVGHQAFQAIRGVMRVLGRFSHGRGPPAPVAFRL